MGTTFALVMSSYSSSSNGTPSSSAKTPFLPSKLNRQSYPHFTDDSSLVDDCLASTRRSWHSLLRFWKTRGKQSSWALFLEVAHQLRRNMALRRLLSAPHVLVLVWVLVMLWGERWVFHTTVERCRWENWEKWVSLTELGEFFTSRPID